VFTANGGLARAWSLSAGWIGRTDSVHVVDQRAASPGDLGSWMA
jgi:hypothetical protein